MNHRQAALLALLLPLTSLAQDAPAPGEVASPPAVEDGTASAEELESFKDAVDRFTGRMTELQQDVRQIIDQRESDEREHLQRSYKDLITGLDEDDQALRSTAIKRFETFLDKYPTSEHSPHVMFRLSELYFERSEEEWFVADNEYQAMFEGMSIADLETAPEEPKKDYRRSVRLYERVISDYPDYEYTDGCYYMLGYCLSEPKSSLYDEEGGLEYFKKLVAKHPESEFAASAHLRIGEYYFDYNDLAAAIPHYERVVALEGPQGKFYDAGLYKLAWSYYKLSEYDKALALLNQLLDWSESIHIERTGRKSSMVPEAVEYTAISFSDVAERTGRSPLDVAKTFYSGIGERGYEHDVYVRLADVLTQQARYLEAIDVYFYLQSRWPEHGDNPVYQWTIGTLYMSLPDPDPDRAQNAVAVLNERYNDETQWWVANRANPDALNIARGYIERSLAAVAVQHHQAALASGEPSDFAKAADFYGQYLAKFPFAEDYYQINWYEAETLYSAGKLAEAEKEYLQLLKGGEHNYKEGASWKVMQIRNQLIKDLFGNHSTVPADAVVETTLTLPSGAKRNVYKLGELHQKFVESCDALVAADFAASAARVQAQLEASRDEGERERLSEELENVIAFNQGLESFRHALAYLPAQILYYHGRYDEARPRFEQIIQTWPQREEAAYSASLMVDSYTADEDLAKVRLYSGKYAAMRLGGDSAVAALKQADFKNLQEGAAFKLALAYVEQGEREKAAAAFLAFLDEFPKSEYAQSALYNAANSYEIVGRVDESIRLFERYVRTYPEDEKSRPLFFRLAGNYASALELNRAVEYYEELYNRTKGKGEAYQDAPSALFNAGFLRIGLGDYGGAAKNFERYARENPEQPDAEQVLFRAGEQWEQVGDREALRFYRAYVKAYPSTHPDHVMEAYHRIAVIVERTAKDRDIDRAWSDLAAAYAALAPGGNVGSRGRHYAAHAEFRLVQAALEAFKEIKFTSNDEKNAQILLEDKLAQLAAVENHAMSVVQTYQDFDYSSGAIYVVGMAYLVYSDMLFNAPPPKDLDEEELVFYQELIDEKRIPVEDKGRARLEAVLQSAVDQGMWSEFQTKSQNELNRRYPTDFSREQLEFRGVPDSSVIPAAGPMSVRRTKAKPGKTEPGKTEPGKSEPTAPEAPSGGADPATPTAPSGGGQ